MRVFMETYLPGLTLPDTLLDQTFTPKSEPIKDVPAMANAPQETTLMTALAIGAPPTLAPIAPSKAKERRAVATTAAMIDVAGENRVARIGTEAAALNVTPEAIAAWNGRALCVSTIPTSSRR